jgi:hypothetical protein
MCEPSYHDAMFLHDATRDAIRQLAERDAAAEVDPITRLSSIRSAIAALERDPATLAAVRDSLDDGSGWDAIARAAGIKPAAAKWRWQGTDDEIAARHEAGRKRAERPSSVPQHLPGFSVSEAAKKLGISPQGVYLRIDRGKLRAETITIEDGRSYKRVFLE